MKIIIEVGHPAQVHLFKNIIWNLQQRDHEIKIAALEREGIVWQLLNRYGLDFEPIGTSKKNIFWKVITLLKIDLKLLKIARKFQPDIFVSISSVPSGHISKLLNKPHISFTDSEPTPFVIFMALPFTDVVITPSCFKRKLPQTKHIRINGYKELAYLHPNWFKPNPDVLDMLGVSKNEKYVILRYSAFDAFHDIRIKGFSSDDKRKLVKELEKYGRVFISSELKFPSNLEKYAINIPFHRMHDAIYYASLVVGDTQTSTTESACLGTPAIRCNSFVGPNDMSNFIELEQKYGLIFNFRNTDDAIEKAIELIQQPNLKQEWQKKRDKLLKDKIDVTAFMTWFIENYPKSFQIMKENPEYQERFK